MKKLLSTLFAWLTRFSTELSLLMVLAATLGSLYFSDILKYPPCSLCWWQRIFTYPLVIMFGIALWRKDKHIYIYALPLASIGFLFAFYHNVIYYIAKYNPGSIAPCDANGISCTQGYIEWFSIITIPLLSLLNFLAVMVLQGLAANKASQKQ